MAWLSYTNPVWVFQLKPTYTFFSDKFFVCAWKGTQNLSVIQFEIFSQDKLSKGEYFSLQNLIYLNPFAFICANLRPIILLAGEFKR